ncbi:hypothetical protein COCNU_11G007510 [Cocos nucifera]|uniref:Secreted protein n=1 Tax=Cocos nucifera TaxID=13894 RepID=A0A8K0IPF3_COCNU|nr:hypothetical protein COCNU_11G007510 [Cocos nucifera]
MASIRACVVIAVLACFLLMRSDEVAAQKVEETPQENAVGASARTTGHHCNPANETCRPGDPDSSDNEAESSTLHVAPSSDDDDNDLDDVAEEPDEELVVLGH